MKQRLLFSTLILLIISCSSPAKKEIETFVFDYENVLSKQEESRFDSLFRGHEKRTTNEIVIVTTPDYGNDKDIINYARKFGNTMGIGKKDKDNAVIIAFSKANRETRISTGYGTEKILSDQIAEQIIDSLMIPEFKKENFFDGLWLGSKAVVDFLDKPENKLK